MKPLELTPREPGSEVVIAGYRVGRLLRRHSAEDAVYSALEVESDRPVELRVVTERDDTERHARFMSDSTLLAALHHPNLPEVLGAGEADEGLYLATAELDGRPLSELARDGGLPPMRAVRLLGDVADALDSAHAEDLVHGDLSADNVIVVERQVEQAYLVDFLLGSRRTAAGPAATTPAGDVRGLARTLSEVLGGRQDIPQELDALVARAMSSPEGSAGELIADAARSLVAGPQRVLEPAEERAPAPAPPAPAALTPAWESAPASAPPPPAEPTPPTPPSAAGDVAPAGSVPAWAAAPPAAPVAEPGRLRRAFSANMPALAAGALVLAAAAAGYFLGQPADGDSASTASAGGVELTLPDGWEAAGGGGSIPGIPLDGALGAGPGGNSVALVSGRVQGLLGSVYPADLAKRVDRRPPEPRAVRLANAEALRFSRLDARGGPITLFVIPTSAGTVAAACAEGPARSACESSVSSLALQGAEASSIQAGERFGRRLDGIVGALERRRGAALRRLSSAATSGEQARAAAGVEAAYGSARSSLAKAQAPPAAAAAQERLGSELAGLQRSYARLATAARRRAGAAFASARRAALRAEVRLRSTLRRI